MSKQKIILYSILLLGCLGALAYILFFNNTTEELGVPQELLNQTTREIGSPSVSAAGSIAKPDAPRGFSTPAVFPEQTKLDASVFTSADFTVLRDYTPLTIQASEIGRVNPYDNY